MYHFVLTIYKIFNPSNAELNPICNLLALLGAHHILHVSRIGVNFNLNLYSQNAYLHLLLPCAQTSKVLHYKSNILVHCSVTDMLLCILFVRRPIKNLKIISCYQTK